MLIGSSTKTSAVSTTYITDSYVDKLFCFAEHSRLRTRIHSSQNQLSENCHSWRLALVCLYLVLSFRLRLILDLGFFLYQSSASATILSRRLQPFVLIKRIHPFCCSDTILIKSNHPLSHTRPPQSILPLLQIYYNK